MVAQPQTVSPTATFYKDSVLTQLSELKAELADRYAVKEIGVFGSVARGEAKASSDIDIVVHMQPNILKRVCLKAELEERFGRPIDVVRYWTGMNQYLKARIEREAIYA